MPTRNASAVWNGGLKGGNGTFKGETGLGGAYNFGSRFENATGSNTTLSNPEELLAAAEAACFSMALSGALEKNGAPPTKVETRAGCSVEKGATGFDITKIELTVTVSGAKIDKAAFDKIVEETKNGCPVSRALKAVPITVQASLA